LSQRVDKFLVNFDKLRDTSNGQQSLEALRNLLKREAFFLDEERKWLQSQRQQENSPSSRPVQTEDRDLSVQHQNLRLELELQ